MKRFCMIAVLVLAGCTADPVRSDRTNNADLDVSTLFDYDGCRMYRFEDGGRFIYFARCGSDVRTSWGETHSNGKTAYTTNHDVQTVEK